MNRKQKREGAARRPSFAARLAGALLALVLLVAAGAGAAGWWAWRTYTEAPLAAQGAPARVVLIPKGSGVGRIGEILAEAGVISDARIFRGAVALLGVDQELRAGEYEIPANASMRDVIDLLMSGRTVLHAFTAPEGLTSAVLMKMLADEPLLTGDLPAMPPAEGALLPDTYMFQRGDTRQSVLDAMMKARKDVLASLWEGRQADLPVTTPEEALILASIVEKETGLAAERPQVAAVFVNRMRRGMRLESDPTIIYGVCLTTPDSCVDGKLVDDKGARRGIRRSEIDRDTGYNTYRIDRLPPTPICNPGRDAIAAVLNPPVSDALFFVADGSGGHAFATTNAEHEKNVANWRRVEAEASQSGP